MTQSNPSPPPPRRGRSLAQLAVIVAAGAVGVWLGYTPPVATPSAAPPSAPAEALSPLERLLVEADEAIDAEDWASCLARYTEALALDEAHEEARIGQTYCTAEQHSAERWAALQNAVAGRRWRHARNLIASIPADSVYFARAQAMEAEIRAGIRRQAAEQRALALNPPPPPMTYKPPKVSTRMLRPEARPERPEPEPADAPPEPESDDHPDAPFGLDAPLPEDPEARARTLQYRELIGQAIDASAELDEDRAVTLLEDAIDFAPEKHQAYMRLCAIHRANGRTAQALDRCQSWMDREPKASFRRAIRMMLDRIESEELPEE